MPVTPARRLWPAAVASLVALLGIQTAFAQVNVIGTYYRPDQPFPEFNAFWNEGTIEPDDEAAADREDYVKPPAAAQAAVTAETPARGRAGSPEQKRQEASAAAAEKPAGGQSATGEGPLGGSAHVFLHNVGSSAVKVQDVLLGGIGLNDAIAFSDQRIRKKFASIYFAKLSKQQLDGLIAHGEPVWWKADPPEIAPGATAEVIIRLRQKPTVATLPVGLQSETKTLEAKVQVTEAAPRIEGISFTPDLDEAYLYFRHPAGKGTSPIKITLDGKDITNSCKLARDDSLALTPVLVKLGKPLAKGSFHVFGGEYKDGAVAISGLRAWADEFAYGVFGGKPGKANELHIGKQYVDDLVGHNLNVQMPQIGSAAVQAFFKSSEGQKYMTDRGFKLVLSDPGKFGIEDPFALYVHDEPDCGDFKAEGIAENKKAGVLARWVISHADEFREKAPDVMQMLNLNMTFKPHNWHVYGQIPDIFTVDPYYQVRLKDAYWKRPERIPLYSKATYIYMCSSVSQSAAAPNPLHVILYGNRQTDKADKTKVFRFPTPAEKRIEAYYAVAAGAKGLSYWWYTPGGTAYGLGAATMNPPDAQAAALWREIGLVGAEVRTAGQVLQTSCPIDLPVESPENVWVRCLASGDDTLIVLAVNEQYANTDKGTELTPVKDASLTVTLPTWINRATAFEITAAGTRPIRARQDRSGLQLPLGDFDATKMVVITSNPKLRTQLQGYYGSKLAASTAALLKPAKRTR